jgi:hypothetical protein
MGEAGGLRLKLMGLIAETRGGLTIAEEGLRRIQMKLTIPDAAA